jgi:hypothetical protein
MCSANETNRRSIIGGAEGGAPSGAAQIPRVASPGTMRGEMLYRDLGRSGEQVSVIGMGGSHLGLAMVDEDLAIRLIHEGPI